MSSTPHEAGPERRLRLSTMSVVPLILALVMLAVVAIADLAIVHHDRRAAPASLRAATTGAVRLTSSDGDKAIINADGLAPGDARSGTVTITNEGTSAASLDLAQHDLTDRPGVFGGRLSRALLLDIAELTPGGDAPVYHGALDTYPGTSFGTIGGGAARTFRFTVTFPDGGAPAAADSGDNAYQGSSAALVYTWTSTASLGGGAPKLSITVAGPKASDGSVILVRDSFLSKGVAITAVCTGPCRVLNRLLLDAAAAGRFGIRFHRTTTAHAAAQRYVVVGSQTASRKAAGTALVTTRLRRSVRARVRHARRLHLVLSTRISTPKGKLQLHRTTRLLVRAGGKG